MKSEEIKDAIQQATDRLAANLGVQLWKGSAKLLAESLSYVGHAESGDAFES